MFNIYQMCCVVSSLSVPTHNICNPAITTEFIMSIILIALFHIPGVIVTMSLDRVCPHYLDVICQCVSPLSGVTSLLLLLMYAVIAPVYLASVCYLCRRVPIHRL